MQDFFDLLLLDGLRRHLFDDGRRADRIAVGQYQIVRKIATPPQGIGSSQPTK